MELLLSLLPDNLSLIWFFALIGLSFFTSALTASFGIGGGVALLTIMAYAMPVAALIPVHGVVQMGSNLSRSFFQRQYIDPSTLIWFAIGSLIGALAGGQIVIALPDTLLKAIVGGFVLFITWGPKPKLITSSPILTIIAAGFSTLLTMFVGATGPFVAASLSARFQDRHKLVANHAACMSIQHGLKILTFGLLGFAFHQWIPLLVLMIIMGVLGTKVGTILLSKLNPDHFKKGFKFLLTLLALNLLASAPWS